ncbi:hypothetical protein A3I34_01960 [Candidatus Jorgensenbacteria bacterium RIFCSPLOWO2_02_FULL_45_12]|uniref:HD domain-containing protein n=1 Tax=Candidatus Jorgensenbacteria bacterium RIFCSPHIGHO2_02_FULL_45_20 TaxID=1798470 RepID=A0A1F6BMU0_9BACT|nr:MAG: hypothetical protein A3D55_01720 [Candidatus Jorgensenbacteria bacterium RIFCSPHIGHO2_02_FULL_45_20]OGG42262.1 MAG: hypothetical protein A3I34_01960 [Candidatus Jorgensenbacteria bacterium RIFCSPLOWO2_02_FULL_45_12]
MENTIPKEVIDTGNALVACKHEAFIVGGCVRDLIIGVRPNDWDIATDASPDDIRKIFPDSVYENDFGTVGVKTDSDDQTLKMIEVTTFRAEGTYSDKRHPDEVKFVKTIEEDLSRRDFTINAMAIDINPRILSSKSNEISKFAPPAGGQNSKLIRDPYDGQGDLNKKIIRAVGNPDERFEEDALRLLRAVRLSVQLGFSIEQHTKNALKKNSRLLKYIAKERVRDEFQKLILSERAADGIFRLEETGILEFIIPELREGIGCKQNKHHVYEVFEHNTRALEYAARKGYSLEVRLASLLHDIGKPRTKRGQNTEATFHGHEAVGARIAAAALKNLRFSNDVIEKVRHLIRYHMFYYNVGEVSESGVRRFIARVGVENIDDILKVREADRIGSRVPKAFPYKLRHLLFMIEKVRHDPVHPKMLAVRGDDVMKILGIPAGPKIGEILFILLDDVLDDPSLNTKEYLEKRVKDLGSLPGSKLAALAGEGRRKRDSVEEEVEGEMKRKYFVE